MERETHKNSYKKCKSTIYGFESRTCLSDTAWSGVDNSECSDEFRPNNQSLYSTIVELTSSTPVDTNNLTVLLSEYFDISPNIILLDKQDLKSVEQTYVLEIYCENKEMLKMVTEKRKNFNSSLLMELQDKYGLDITEIALMDIVVIEPETPSENNSALIIGCVAAVIVVVIAVAVFFSLRKRKRYVRPVKSRRSRRSFTISHSEFEKRSENRKSRLKRSLPAEIMGDIQVIVPIGNT